jgi:antirestriction protein ArdC
MQAKRDTYQVITDSILAALERCGPVERPWFGPSLTMPRNAASGREYRGSNVIMLWSAAQQAGYNSSVWATFRQWSDMGASVRKGEKGTPVLWFQMLDRKSDAADNDDEDESRQRIPCARLSWVFNACQVDGYADKQPQAPLENLVSPIGTADALIAASGACIRHEGHSAYYHRGNDEIVLPPRELFTGTSTSTPTEAYYAVALHELTHWTGHESRCNREFGKRFGDDAYAFEELVAELGAAFLSAKTRVVIEPRSDHASYIANWIRILKKDRKAFVTAASKAAEASEYLLEKCASLSMVA